MCGTDSQNPQPQPPPPPPPQQQHQQPQGLPLHAAAGSLQAAAHPYPPPAAPVPPGAASAAQLDFVAALSLGDATIRAVVDRAFAAVHGADKATRQLMLIEVQAKQLALSILARQEDLEASAAVEMAAAAAMAAVAQGGDAPGARGPEHEHEAATPQDMMSDEGEG